jgi:peptidyl-prolyl cis-trans isomerase C/foldase protein PrsA
MKKKQYKPQRTQKNKSLNSASSAVQWLKSGFCSIFSVFSVAMISFVFVSCQKASEPPPVKKEVKVVAIINGEKITEDEFKREFSVLRKKRNTDDSIEGEQLHTLKKNLLDQFIEKRLLLQEAKKSNISITEKELEDEVRKITSGYPPGALEDMLKNEKISMTEWRGKIRENLLIERLVVNKYAGSFDVSDKEIDSYYKSNMKDFIKPLKVHALQIVVNGEEDALSVRSELLKGADFGKIAREKSIGLEAEKGGDLGFFSEGQMPQEFDDAIFKLKVGEISHPVKTPYGYHIFKLIERKEPKKIDPADAKENIRKMLMKEKYGEALKKLIASLRENSKIEIYENRI